MVRSSCKDNKQYSEEAFSERKWLDVCGNERCVN